MLSLQLANHQVDKCARVEEVLTQGIAGSILVSVYLLTNQPHIHPDLSLGALALYLLITQPLPQLLSPIMGTGGHMPSCIGSMVVTMSWGSRSVLRGNGVSPVDPSC